MSDLGVGTELVSGPPKKTKTEHVGFRCPTDLVQWVASMAGADASVSASYVWTLERGRDLIEAGGLDLLKKLEGYAAIFGQDRSVLLKRVLESGMADLERQLRSAVRKG